MRLLCHEWRKLLRLPVLWGFLALCLAFNGLLLYQADGLRGWFNQGSALASTLGQRMDGAFVQALEQRPPSEYGSAVLDAARTGENIFETFQLDKLCAYYQNGVLQHSPWAQEKMAEKYAKLAPRQAHLAQTQAALDLYAGPATQAAHQFLYGTLFRALTAEGAILGMLGTLFLLGYEGMHRTTLMVYSTRTGRRRLVLGKLTAGALAAGALGFFFALALESLDKARRGEDAAALRSARVNAWASLLVLAAALVRLDDLLFVQAQTQIGPPVRESTLPA